MAVNPKLVNVLILPQIREVDRRDRTLFVQCRATRLPPHVGSEPVKSCHDGVNMLLLNLHVRIQLVALRNVLFSKQVVSSNLLIKV